jgi:hypothetical protein
MRYQEKSVAQHIVNFYNENAEKKRVSVGWKPKILSRLEFSLKTRFLFLSRVI